MRISYRYDRRGNHSYINIIQKETAVINTFQSLNKQTNELPKTHDRPGRGLGALTKDEIYTYPGNLLQDH
jgi:hypothetical protein